MSKAATQHSTVHVARALPAHLRLATINGVPIRGKRPKKERRSSLAETHAFALDQARHLLEAAEHVERVIKAAREASLGSDAVTMRALWREASIEFGGVVTYARCVERILTQ